MWVSEEPSLGHADSDRFAGPRPNPRTATLDTNRSFYHLAGTFLKSPTLPTKGLSWQRRVEGPALVCGQEAPACLLLWVQPQIPPQKTSWQNHPPAQRDREQLGTGTSHPATPWPPERRDGLPQGSCCLWIPLVLCSSTPVTSSLSSSALSPTQSDILHSAAVPSPATGPRPGGLCPPASWGRMETESQRQQPGDRCGHLPMASNPVAVLVNMTKQAARGGT